jgi:hypothetical protein
MKTLEDRLRELAVGADSVFLNPITVGRLREQGIEIQSLGDSLQKKVSLCSLVTSGKNTLYRC